MTSLHSKPLKRQSLAVQLREQMEALIRSGTWAVGQRIPAEAELKAHFSVSHNTVREAVQGLIHAGLLVARPGDGTYVIASDRFDAALDHRLAESDLGRILEARLAIEKAIVELAVTNRSDEDLADLQQALLHCKNRSGQGIEADLAFHCRIADCACNPILSQVYRVLAGHLGRHLGSYLSERQYEPAAIDLHDELIEALRLRDVALAQRIVERIVAFDYESYANEVSNHSAAGRGAEAFD